MPVKVVLAIVPVHVDMPAFLDHGHCERSAEHHQEKPHAELSGLREAFGNPQLQDQDGNPCEEEDDGVAETPPEPDDA